MSKVFHEDRNLKREITLLRELCYLQLKERIERNGTEEQNLDLEESNQRFIEKGY